MKLNTRDCPALKIFSCPALDPTSEVTALLHVRVFSIEEKFYHYEVSSLPAEGHLCQAVDLRSAAMANAAKHHLVLYCIFVGLASQWATTHCRSGPSDDYSQYAPYKVKGGKTVSYGGASFSARQAFVKDEDMTAFTETFQQHTPADTYTDPPETFPDDHSSFARQTYHVGSETNSGLSSQKDYAESFFDTSDAVIVHRAPEGKHKDGVSKTGVNTSVLILATANALGGCGTGNPIDDCWRCDPNWRSHPQALATCAIGFGRNAIGGKNGRIYVVTTNEDDAQNPQPGTLRYGVTRDEPLWIMFAQSMNLELKAELVMTSFKTIDARGVTVHITGGSQITIQGISHVILHGLHIHDIRPSGPARIRASPTKLVNRGVSDGDGIHILASTNVWVDHCFLSNAADGLIDATHVSTLITVSNNYFTNHNKVMLFGSHPTDYGDRIVQITVAFNKFGPGLHQRMPRCRFGHFHVVNNDYTSGWEIYAIGGSEGPTILSEGNHFSPGAGHKEVTKRIDDGGPTFGGWQNWNWASGNDVFLDGAYFTGSGASAQASGVYAKSFSVSARPGVLVPVMTSSAGPI